MTGCRAIKINKKSVELWIKMFESSHLTETGSILFSAAPLIHHPGQVDLGDGLTQEICSQSSGRKQTPSRYHSRTGHYPGNGRLLFRLKNGHSCSAVWVGLGLEIRISRSLIDFVLIKLNHGRKFIKLGLILKSTFPGVPT